MTTSIKSSFLSVDHYGLVVATSRTLGLAEFIDSKIPKLSNNKKHIIWSALRVYAHKFSGLHLRASIFNSKIF